MISAQTRSTFVARGNRYPPRYPSAGQAGSRSNGLSIAEALFAVRTRMPAGRAIIQRATAAIRAAVPAGATAAGDLNRVGGGGLVERRQRHRLRGGHRRQRKTQAQNGNSKQFHDKFFLSKIVPQCGGFATTQRFG